MEKKQVIISSIIYILSITFSFGQVGRGGYPLTYFEKYSALYKSNSSQRTIGVASTTLKEIDNKFELENAELIKKGCDVCKDKTYYGKGVNADIDIKSMGTLKILDDSSKLWLYKLSSSSAYALQFYFDKFKLPSGARLFFYNENKSMFLGSFTKENNPKNESQKIPFGTQYIAGNTIYIEYYEPKNVEFNSELHIFKIIHSFIDVFKQEVRGPWAPADPLDCEINVSCPLSDLGLDNSWKDEISSVALILSYNNSYNLAGYCTGALINNTKQDGTPFFLTANHCHDDRLNSGDNQWNASSWIFVFNHQDPYCNGDGSSLIQTFSESVFGSDVIASDATSSPKSDYLLLKLYATVQELYPYRVCFAGWNRSESAVTSSSFSIGIHHPRGNVKKIAKSILTPTSVDLVDNGSYYSTVPGTLYWDINWNNGVTETGSSGSPIFSSDHKIFGQIRLSGIACPPFGSGDYGKFSEAWKDVSFANALDPKNSGVTSLNTYCPSNVNTCNNGILDLGEVGVDCGGVCPACPGGYVPPPNNCHNGIRDGNEIGVDCGGGCPMCVPQQAGLGNGLDVSEDDHSCDAYYEDFSNPHCFVDVSKFDIYDPSTFTRAFLNSPQCIQGNWNAEHGRPSLIPGFNNVGVYIWGTGSGIADPEDGGVWYQNFGSDLFFTSEAGFTTNRDYTLSFYARAIKAGADVYYGTLRFYLANGLVPNTLNDDMPIRIKNGFKLPIPSVGYYLRSYGQKIPFNVYYIGEYNYGFRETWQFHKFKFTPPNNNYNQLICIADINELSPPDDRVARFYLDNLAICSECNGSGSNDITYDNSTLPSITTVKNSITAKNENINAGANVKFFAGNEIKLEDGFIAEKGSNFLASILGCDFNSYRMAFSNDSNKIHHVNMQKMQGVSPENIFSFERPKSPHKSLEYLLRKENTLNQNLQSNLFNEIQYRKIINANSWTISPNPLKKAAIFSHFLYEPNYVSIFIYDIYGNEISKVVENKYFEAGIINIPFDSEKIGSGLYLCKLAAGDHEEVKKIVIIK